MSSNPIDEPSWSVCVDLDTQPKSRIAEQVADEPVVLRPPRASSFDNFFSRHTSATTNELGPLSRTFVRNLHIARSVGWFLLSALFTALLAPSALNMGWWLSCVTVAVLFPHIATWSILKSGRFVETNFGFQFLETSLAVFYCSLLGFDPWLLTTVTAIYFLNAVLANGIAAGVLMLVLVVPIGAAVTLIPLPQTDIPAYGHILIGGALILYLGLIGYRTHKLSVDYSRDRKQLTQETSKVEQLHQHLIDTIVQPYVSANEFVSLIGSRISVQEAEAFESRIQQRQQLESLGRRAGGIAHDAKNLLQPILMMSEMLRTDLAHQPECVEMLDDMIAASHRANDLLTRLQHSSQSSHGIHTACNMCETVSEAVRLLHQSAPQFITIVFEHTALSDESTHVSLQSTTLHQVIMNLGLNGIQSMDGTGTLEITLAEFDPTQEELVLPEHLIDQDCVTITVQDTGCGISKTQIDKIFEPYFTTKKHSGGTGLGLATTQAIVHDAGGMIRVLSKAHVGTQFRILLPTSTAPTKTG